MCACSIMSDSLRPPWTVARQFPLSPRDPRQEYWSGWPFPPPGDLPNPGTEAASLAPPALAGRFSTNCAPWEAPVSLSHI